MHWRAFCHNGDGTYSQRDYPFVGYQAYQQSNYGETVGDVEAVGAGDDCNSEIVINAKGSVGLG